MHRLTSLLRRAPSTSIRVQRMTLEERLAARNKDKPVKEIITVTPLAKQRLLETVDHHRGQAVIEAMEAKSEFGARGLDPKDVLSASELSAISQGHKYLRLSLKDKGCNGQSYDLAIVKQKDPRDFKITITDNPQGPHLLIYHKAELFVTGSEMDYDDNRLSSGFVFKNPQVDGVCGCGESFNFDLALNK